MSTPENPTAKLVVELPAHLERNSDEAGELVTAQILAKAAELIVAGERPAFEVWYPGTTVDDFDAVEVAPDGTITTLPPYGELEQAVGA